MTVIDEKVLKENIEKGIEKIATEVVPAIVDDKIKEVKEDVKEVKENMKEVVKTIHIKEKSDTTKQIEKTANLFKALARWDLAEVKTLSEGTDADGGFLVPEEFEKTLFTAIGKYGVARRLARKYPMKTDVKNITATDSTVEAYIVGEGQAITSSNPTFRQIRLEARKIAALIPATNELIDDSMTTDEVFNIVLDLVAKKFAEIEDQQVLAGDGSGLNFTGVLNAWSVYSLPSGKTSINDVTADDVIAMVYGLKDKYVRGKNPKWFINKTVLGVLRKLTDKNGVKLLVDDYTGGNPTLLGYEVITTDVLPGTADDGADKKFFAFGDLDFYALGVRKGITSEIGYRSGDFEKDIKSLKVIERVWGAILDSNAFVVLKTAAS